MIDPSHQTFQDIQKLDKFLRKCNMLFEDPYLPDDHPTHDEAIVARRSITNLDEYFRHIGFSNVHLRYIREVVDHTEGEDWSRVSQFIKEANKELIALNTAYEESTRQERNIYSQLTQDHKEYQGRGYANTRLSKIEEAPSRLTDDTKFMTPDMVQYVHSLHSDRSEYPSSRQTNGVSQSGRYSNHSVQSDRSEHLSGHSHRNEHLSGHSHRSEHLSGHSHRNEHHSGHSHRSEHLSGHSHRTEHHSGHSKRSEHHSEHSHRGEPYSGHSHRSEHQSHQSVMDEDLRLQLHLNLENMDQPQVNETTMPDPEATLPERLEQIEDTKRRGELASNAMKQNPDIADLSDTNRPGKVAERFSSLYDDIWTDACEQLTSHYQHDGNGERKAILDLAAILRATFEFTSKLVETQKERIAHQTMEIMLDPCSDRKQEEDENPFRHEKVLGLYAASCIKDTADLSVPALQKHFSLHLFPTHLTRVSELSTVKTYTDKCVELTWFMNVQDPPMVLLWPSMLTTDTDSITDYFRYCTATGTILDHEVWPAVFLYKDGPLVAKGVAQFKESAS